MGIDSRSVLAPQFLQQFNYGVTMGIDSRSLLALFITILFWASAFAGIRAGLAAYSPGHFVLLRFLVASITLAIYATSTRMRLPDKADVLRIILLGFLGFTVYHVSLTFGEVRVTAGAASLLISSAPIMIALLSTLLLGERLRWLGWLGTLMSFSGVALITIGEGKAMQFEPAALLASFAAFGTSWYAVLQKPLLKKYRAIELVTYCIWSGTFFMLVFLPGFGHALLHAPIEATLAAVYLGICATAIGYVTFSYALSKAPASLVASYIYIIPVFAILIAWLWIKEVPTLLSLVGGAVVLCGVVLVTTRGYEKK